MSAACPWCEAPRGSGSSCPRCGADYAKAEQIKKHGRAALAVAAPPAATEDVDIPIVTHDVELAVEDLGFRGDPQTELRFRIFALPAMLLVAAAFQAFEAGRFVQRLAFTMPVHELGHAVTAWLCGFAAIPTLWVTISFDERGYLMPVLVFAAIAWTIRRGWQVDSRALLLLGATLLVLQIIGTLFIKEHVAQGLIVFGGDGMGMVLATLLMASFYFGRHTQLYRGSLRWGFLAIGAAAYADIGATWWRARFDPSEIPLTTREGGMESDALRLINEFGWTEPTLVSRHLSLWIACLLALGLIYVWGVKTGAADARTAIRSEPS